ncbi:MAG: hypothetical protein HOO06_14410 [Bdellovibrionaceae bacterium]|jgi:hypothetical protein|nr:hypothetical protein [Pseudobdellovibrionaceae bacterium]
MSVTTVDFSRRHLFDDKFSSAFKRLNNILDKVYKCPSAYKAFLKPEDRNENILISILKKNNPLTFSNKILYPLTSEKNIVGYIEVKNTKVLTPSQKERIKDTIQLIFHSFFNESSSLSPSTQSSMESFTKNLVKIKSSFGGAKPTQHPNVSFHKKNPADVTVLKHSWLIETISDHELVKIAHEIHDKTKRYAFLHFSDIAENKRTPESLKQIGDATLFIPELKNLSPKDQLHIVASLKNFKFQLDTPKFIIGNFDSLESLAKNHPLAEFISKFPKVIQDIRFTRPFDPKLFNSFLNQ